MSNPFAGPELADKQRSILSNAHVALSWARVSQHMSSPVHLLQNLVGVGRPQIRFGLPIVHVDVALEAILYPNFTDFESDAFRKNIHFGGTSSVRLR
jgi:hypothetical protein